MTYVYFVQWKPFCATIELPKNEYVAVMTPHLMKKVIPGRRIPGAGGITKGFADKVWLVALPSDALNKVNLHLRDIDLYIEIKEFSLSVIADSGTIFTQTINELIPSAIYPLEVHK